MAGDQLKALLQLASGVGDMTRARAQDVARGLLELPGGESAGRVTGQVAALADELLATATSNRENLLGLVRAEVEDAVGRLGLAPSSENAQLKEELEQLRLENASLRAKLELREAADASAGRAARKRSTSRAAKRPTTGTAGESSVPASSSGKRSSAKQATSKRAASKRTTSARTGRPATTRASGTSGSARGHRRATSEPTSGPDADGSTS